MEELHSSKSLGFRGVVMMTTAIGAVAVACASVRH